MDRVWLETEAQERTCQGDPSRRSISSAAALETEGPSQERYLDPDQASNRLLCCTLSGNDLR